MLLTWLRYSQDDGFDRSWLIISGSAKSGAPARSCRVFAGNPAPITSSPALRSGIAEQHANTVHRVGPGSPISRNAAGHRRCCCWSSVNCRGATMSHDRQIRPAGRAAPPLECATRRMRASARRGPRHGGRRGPSVDGRGWRPHRSLGPASPAGASVQVWLFAARLQRVRVGRAARWDRQQAHMRPTADLRGTAMSGLLRCWTAYALLRLAGGLANVGRARRLA